MSDEGYFNSTAYYDQNYADKMKDLWSMITADATPKEQAFEDLDLLWT